MSERFVTRRAVSVSARLAVLSGWLAITTSAVAAGYPSTPTTLTYHFTDCSGPPGTPATLDGVKQPGGAAALHLVDGRGIFVAVQAIDVESGAILFTTPGFERNDVPTITCQLIHPVTLGLQLVTGFIAPVG